MTDPVVQQKVFGSLKAFEPEEETISSYLERAELYFAANGVEEARQTSVLLTVIGPRNYSVVKSLVAPDLPKDKTYKELEAVLKAHFQPKPLIIAERFRFYQRSQAATESVLDYIAELRRLAITCDFDAFLDQALRDKFVCGLKSESIQKRLLTERDLTVTRAVELASGMETAATDARELKHPASTSAKVCQTVDKSQPGVPQQRCYRCGKTDHEGRACRFKQAKCHKCGKTGHIAPVCRSGAKGQGNHKGPHHKAKKTHHIEGVHTETEESFKSELPIFASTVKHAPTKAIRVAVQVAGRTLYMEVDTGAAVSLIPESVYRRRFAKIPLQPSRLELATYTGEPMKVIGTFSAKVRYQQQKPPDLELVVVAGDGPCLLGRSWLKHIRLDWVSISSVMSIASRQPHQRIVEQYKDVFADELGTIRPFTAKLSVAKEAKPKFYKARPVPFALKGGVEETLDRLEAHGVLEKVTHSDWASPIVTVPKKDGSIRVCGDYKVTVNPVLDVDKYPLPRPEDLFAALSGGKQFTTLDLTHAYNQLPLDPDSEKYAVVNTHRGLYRYKRLPFGIASAPALFQRMMDQILQGMAHVICYIDDICITGTTDEEHLANLAEVLRRLREHGVRLKKDKCRFLRDSVEYLGHRIDSKGLHATDSKLKAITEAPSPKNVQELRAFLGLLNYYGRFIPNRATLSQPLHQLLCKDSRWKWTKECDKAFKTIKDTLVSSSFLTHYNPTLPLKLAGDASPYGIGAVISHTMEDGTEQPVAFASRTLSKSEQNYSQIEKEALSLIYGVKKFHSYLFGCRFTLTTDHKPLTTIFGPKQGIPPLAAARLQRWALILAAYNYSIEYRPTGEHANADSLSRLPLKSPDGPVTSDEPAIFNVSQIESLPVTAKQLQAATRTDPVLSKVLKCITDGWPDKCSEELHPYWTRRLELTVEGGCIMWGIRVVAPKKLQDPLLSELHRDHPGISRMKTVARSYVWWPGLDRAIEDLAKGCTSCQAVKRAPAVAPLQPWVWPNQPWKRVHLDFAGPFQGSMFLVAVDAHSKWPEVHLMKETTAAKTIDILRQMFCTFGLPEQLVTDNGPQFVSEDFVVFTRSNGIKHIRSAPYHPATNGLAERFVQSLKSALKASLGDGLSLQRRVGNFLFTYRSTPHATTGVSPASLFLHRQLRTRLDLLHPNSESQVLSKQAQQKQQHDHRARDRVFMVGQSVMARNFRPGAEWVAAEIVERLGPLTYLVETSDRQLWRRHVDHLKELVERRVSTESLGGDCVDWDSSAQETAAPEVSGTATAEHPPTTATSQLGQPSPEPVGRAQSSTSMSTTPTTATATAARPESSTTAGTTPLSPTPRYPARAHQRPNYFGW